MEGLWDEGQAQGRQAYCAGRQGYCAGREGTKVIGVLGRVGRRYEGLIKAAA